MNRPFWMKFLVSILIFMTIVYGILPTNAILATGAKIDAESIEATHTGIMKVVTEEEAGFNRYAEGWYHTQMSTNNVTDFAENGNIVYVENGEVKYPQTNGEGNFYLEAGKTYYYVTNNPENNLGYTVVNSGLAEYEDELPDMTTEEVGEALSNEDDEDDASKLEHLITGLLMLLGTAAYGLVCLVLGGRFSIERVIFNDYTNTKLAFFTSDIATFGENDFIASTNLRETLNDFFSFFRGIAFAAYLIILVYIGVKILLGSTAEKGSRHKELLLYWVEGVLILFLFPFIMKYTIHINNAFVSFVGANKDTYITIKMPEAENMDGGLESFDDGLIEEIRTLLFGQEDFMSYMYKEACDRGWLVYAICWYVMFFQMIGFLIVYFKRVLITMFLIAIFPLVMISYAFDKVGDGKSQAFGNWMKEYLLNIFIQSFHAIAYVLIMSIVSELGSDPSEYWLVMLISLTFISKGDDILRKIFSLESSANTVKSIGKSFAQVAAVKGITSGIKGAGSMMFGEKSRFRKVVKSTNELDNLKWRNRENRANRESAVLELNSLQSDTSDNFVNNVRVRPTDMADDVLRNDIKESLDIALRRKNATEDEYRNAMDRLTGYVNQTEDERVQQILNEEAANLSDEEAAMLDNLLRQNAAVNALLVGGRNINFRQNIDIVLSCLKKGKDGNYTPESMALIKKIANSEEDLQALGLLGNVKFNKDNIIEVEQRGQENRVSNHPYFVERESKQKVKGRGAARRNKEGAPESKTSFEAKRKEREAAKVGGGSRSSSSSSSRTSRTVSSTSGGTKKEKYTRGRSKVKGQERAIYANDKLSRRGGKVTTRARRVNSINEKIKKSGGLKKQLKPHEKVTNSQGVSAATLGAGAVLKKSNKTSQVVNAAVASSRAEKQKLTGFDRVYRYFSMPKTDNSKSSSTATSYSNIVPTKERVNTKGERVIRGKMEEVEVRKVAVEDAQEKLKRKRKKTKITGKRGYLSRSYEQDDTKGKKNARNTSTRVNIPGASGSSAAARSYGGGARQNPGASIAGMQGSVESLEGILNDTEMSTRSRPMSFNDKERTNGGKIFDKVVSKDAMKPVIDTDEKVRDDLMSIATSISILKESGKGEHTASKLLENIANIRKISESYKGELEQDVVNKIISDLGFKLDDYESYVRVKILNDPDSVGNNRKVIEDCKDYVKTTEMPGFIRDRLGYNMDDLREGVNLKYVKKTNSESDGIKSSELSTAAKEKYELAMKRRELERKIAGYDKEYESNMESIKNEKKKIVKDAALGVLEIGAVNTVAIGTAFIGAGMTVDGKQDSAFDVPQKLLQGYSLGTSMYGDIKNSIKDEYKDTKESVKDIYDDLKWYMLGGKSDSSRVQSTSNQSNSNSSNNSSNNSSGNETEALHDLEKRIYGLKDKTRVVGTSFSDRKKNN